MDKKSKDGVFAVILILFGCFVLYESRAMQLRAARRPYNIADFGISPAMLPMILGAALILFSLLLLLGTLKGEAKPLATLSRRLRGASSRFIRAAGGADMRDMAVSVVIMGAYTFGILGRVPFWAGAMIFLVGLLFFLRASKAWVILTASGASVALIVLLFERFFKTILP